MVPQLAHALGHGTHGAEGAPGSGPVEEHDNKADEEGGEHQAVKAEAELGHPVGDHTGGIGPAPGHPDGPEELDDLTQGGGSGKDKPGLEQHVAEHGQEEDQEAVPETLGGHPAGGRLPAGQLQPSAQQGEELSPSAQVVAEKLVSSKNGQGQGKEKVDHAQPGEQNVEEAQGKEQNGPEPEIVVPMSLFHA